MTPTEDDVYALVEDQDEGLLVLLAVRWPELDGLGRLRFADAEPVEVPLAQSELENALRRRRSEEEQRPVRIGDVFLVRGLAAGRLPEASLADWGQLFDVTGPARDAAKAALFAAAAPRVSADDADALGLDVQASPDESPPAGTAAGPVV